MTNDFYKKFFHIFLLAIVISICYSGTLENSWHFDDFHNIVENKNVHIDNLSWEQIKKSFVNPSSDKINRPLARFSFAINYLFSGLDTTSYQVVNILIHFICSAFAYLVFIITLNIYREKNRSSVTNNFVLEIALLGSVFWAIHPIQTQAVTYIVQRMASMAAMFYMISLYSYLKWRLEEENRKKLVYLILCLLFWIAGMFSKQNVIMLPFSIIAYEIIIFKTSIFIKKRFKILSLASIVIILVFVFSIMAESIIDYFNKLYAYRTYTMWERLITEPIIITRYLFLLLFPIADFLTLESNIFASKGLFSPPITIVSVFFVFIIISLSLNFSKKYPIMSFAIIFYFINHFVESTFIGLELYFEHRNYLPSIFIFLAISYFFIKIFIYYRDRNEKFMYFVFVFLCISIIFSEGNATYLRNEVWRDEISLNLDNIKKSPLNIRGYNNLAAEYIKIGQNEKAIEYLKQGEQIYNKNKELYQKNAIADFYHNAGLIQLHRNKNIEKATQLLIKSADLDPSDPKTHYQLAIAFFKLGDLANAETAIFNAAQLKDDEPKIFNLFGRILYALEKYDLAINAFGKGIEIEKKRELYFNYAATYLAVGDSKRARSILISMDSDKNDLLYNLYRLVISTESEKKHFAKNVIFLIKKEDIDYCTWIEEVNENNHVRIIFPDISNFKKLLAQTYIDELESQIDNFYSDINVLNKNCITL